MRDVMMKAQELAEAILDSEIYRKMKQQEADVKHDPEAAAALSDMIEKRGKVEDILSSANMDANELAEASREDFQTMMDNVNRILRLVITGQTEDEDGRSSGCNGNCSGCSGCR